MAVDLERHHVNLPHLEGMRFNGWSTDPNDRSGYIRFMTTKSDVTFYATWVKIKYVNSVDISFEEPTAYCDVSTSSRFVLNTKNVTINKIEWLHDGTVLDEYFEFVEGETYRIHVIVNTQGEYIFSDDPTVTFTIPQWPRFPAEAITTSTTMQIM